MSSIVSEFFEITTVMDLLTSEGLLFLLSTTIVLYVAKKTYNLMSSFDLVQELTGHDNKAISLSFAGYMFGVGLIQYGLLTSPAKEGINLWVEIGTTMVWGLVGIILLLIARLVNDKVLMHSFDNTKEIVQDRNVGTGAVECGSFIGSALMINAALSGDDYGFVTSLATTLIYFVMGQVGFTIFGFIYCKVLRFDVHDEIEKDNASAGVSYGFNLVAIGLLLSGFIKYSDSLLGFFIWLLFAVLLMLSCRYLVDKYILPGDLLDEEVTKDQNWGASLIEGASALATAFIVNGAFF